MSVEQLMSPQSIAELTGLGYNTVRRAIQRGELPGFKVAGKLRVRESDFEAWAYGQPVQPPPRVPRALPPERRRSHPPPRGSVAALDEIERSAADAG